jgi:hypothetical protein
VEVVPFWSLDTQSQAGRPSVGLILLSLAARNFSIGSPDLAVRRGRPSRFCSSQRYSAPYSPGCRRGQVIYIELCGDALLGDDARHCFTIMEAKQTKINDLWARTLKIFNCVRRPARPLRLTSTAARSTLKYSSPVIALGPSGRAGLTTTRAPGCVPSLQPAGPHSCCASRIRRPRGGSEESDVFPGAPGQNPLHV